MSYPLARDGIYWTVQGEGHLTGIPMAFVRLAGCSIGCPHCDTDYRVAARLDAAEIVQVVEGITPAGTRDRWVWITGGEPTDHCLTPLLLALKRAGYTVALATAGERQVTDPVDWLSVSPHRPGRLAQRFGHEIKIVHGLGGELAALAAEADAADYWFRYVQPLSLNGAVDTASVQLCWDWVRTHPNWALSEQHHKRWGIA